ncbi:phosphate ABC transporter permease PstA [Protaetiibacter intestinalis]|uniref:Phosphate transport system permease protein PstA n=1 Tax=Protaetiibacter intestinalis TaxID=2419774 RepID=A0A387B552_9MICO|nr:phosphate ABC transporter permease PstA [Protaetiibacter intestinalis]AYF97437.1 phosphate ABC transporter permease PstA [Protaetiibacter intestinalis]
MTTGTAPAPRLVANAFTAGKLPRWMPWPILAGSLAVALAAFGLMAAAAEEEFNWIAGTIVGVILFVVVNWVIARLVEGGRQAADRLVTSLVTGAFVLALIPLVWLTLTVVVDGLPTLLDGGFLSNSMRNVVGEGGGALHAIVGTLIITGLAAVISIPIGLMTAIYLVEYGTGKLARGITFLVDVMTGIPSIVAGLATYALFALFFGDGVRSGFAGSVALSILMIPVVVRSSEEIIRLVPNELREASYALGVPKWRTIAKVVLPTSIAGITTGVMLSISRVIGETAPLLIVAGFTASMNYNPFSERMMSLPVFVYTQYTIPGIDPDPYIARAWAGALTLVLIVALLNAVARLVSHFFSPKLGR